MIAGPYFRFEIVKICSWLICKFSSAAERRKDDCGGRAPVERSRPGRRVGEPAVFLAGSPLAGDCSRKTTSREAQRLWRTVDRPNLMVKVVGTAEGIASVEALIAEGINVNVTLMFSLQHYEAVAAAYIRGLSRCKLPEHVASVASFFVSRVDTQVDRALEEIGTSDAFCLGLRPSAGRDRKKKAFCCFSRFKRRGQLIAHLAWARCLPRRFHCRQESTPRV